MGSKSRHLEEGLDGRRLGSSSLGIGNILRKTLPKLGKQLRHHKTIMLITYFATWVLCYSFTLRNSKFIKPAALATYGRVQELACTSVHWTNANQCGLNGRNCRPFTGEDLPFRCPSGCRSAKKITPFTVGGQEFNYRPLVVGGSINGSTAIYRGDSFICGAAIHAGVITNSQGGCGVLRREGETTSFPSVQKNGIDSIGFNSDFPLSFSFDMTFGTSQSICDNKDARWKLLNISILFGLLLPFLLKSTSHFFGTVFTVVFFHVALVSDPPDEPHMLNFSAVISAAFGNYLPAAFVALVLFHQFVRHTLPERLFNLRTWLWMWAVWCGSLCNVAEQMIPVQRLTLRDMQQPGAVFATTTICIIIAFCVFDQIQFHHQEGRLTYYLKFYGLVAGMLCVAANLPYMQLRLHHYAWALLLIPGASANTWRASIYQGLLLGIFINGVARWGFASVLQTEEEVFLGPISTALPTIPKAVINGSSISFTWKTMVKGWNGIYVLVNDVLEYQGFMEGDDLRFDYTRDWNATRPIFFRFGLIRYDYFRGLSNGYHTKPVVWGIDGIVERLN